MNAFRLSHATRRLSLAYAVGLVLWLAAFRYWGERSPWLILPLFAPLWLWGLPLLGLIPAAIAWHRRSLALLLPCLLFFLLGPYGWHWHGGAGRPEEEGASRITVMTYNTGENNGTPLEPFFDREKPDLLLLQDVRGRRYRFADPFRKGYFHAARGEFTILSRWPIRSATPIRLSGATTLAAVRFEIDHPAHPFAVYNIHFPTPRPDVIELFTGSQPVRQRLARYQAAHAKRLALYGLFVEQLADDPLPHLLVGDFNAPSWGYLHSLFSRRFDDAFSRTGNGFGFTFPGWDPWLPTFFGPWLRLDFIFSAPPWHPVACKVEPQRATQHQAVVATLEWRPEP
ncbi:MAG TPA: endonuclease/exonuclease/phosphatase family protein [Chthoniobacteraceae bacterium]|nr:endonuclease/exonuclease/phosphatase family protein [Chthoniobacteraceae bacterium]